MHREQAGALGFQIIWSLGDYDVHNIPLWQKHEEVSKNRLSTSMAHHRACVMVCNSALSHYIQTYQVHRFLYPSI